MKKIPGFRLMDKAASGDVSYETPVSQKLDSGLELGVWDEELKERFRVLKRKSNGEGIFVYFLKKFN